MSAVEQSNAVATAMTDNVDLPVLEIREMRETDAHLVQEFCLNNLMQRTRLSNQYVYSSPIWLSIFLSAIAWATKTTEPWVHNDWGRWAFLCCAISALSLVGVDYFTFFYYEKRTKAAHEEDEFLQDPVKFLAQKKGKCWIAMYGAGLAGCIVLQSPKDKSSKAAEITNWFVRTRYREKGLGGDLLREALAEAKKTRIAKVTIDTTSINKRANRSLGKTGFVKVKSALDANVYWKMLRISNMTWSIDPQSLDDSILKQD